MSQPAAHRSTDGVSGEGEQGPRGARQTQQLLPLPLREDATATQDRRVERVGAGGEDFVQAGQLMQVG